VLLDSFDILPFTLVALVFPFALKVYNGVLPSRLLPASGGDLVP